jgi:hypothetical protein
LKLQSDRVCYPVSHFLPTTPYFYHIGIQRTWQHAPSGFTHPYLITRLYSLFLIATYSTAAWAGDGDLGPLIIAGFFGLIGLIAGAIGTSFLSARKLIKALLLIPMMALGGAIGFGLTIFAMEMLKTPEQKAEMELQNGLPKLFIFSCSGTNSALTQYLQEMSLIMRGQGERIEKALECTHSHPWGIKGVDSTEPKSLQFKANTFVILSQELYRVSLGAKDYYCSFLKHLHEQHATPLLQALREAKLPIACDDPAEPPWVSGLEAYDSWKAEPKVSEEIWAWVMFLKASGVDFKNVPANTETLISRVVGNGDPRLIRFALEEGSDPLGFTGKKWPSGEFPKATEIWKERQNLPSDNPHGYSGLNYTSPKELADIAFIDRKMAEAAK